MGACMANPESQSAPRVGEMDRWLCQMKRTRRKLVQGFIADVCCRFVVTVSECSNQRSMVLFSLPIGAVGCKRFRPRNRDASIGLACTYPNKLSPELEGEQQLAGMPSARTATGPAYGP